MGKFSSGRREDLYLLEVEPYTPADHFLDGKADPEFRTKPKTALELVEWAVEMEIPFRAVGGRTSSMVSIASSQRD